MRVCKKDTDNLSIAGYNPYSITFLNALIHYIIPDKQISIDVRRIVCSLK